MDKNLELESFTEVRTRDLESGQRWGNGDPKLSEAIDEIIDKGSKVADAMAVCGYVQALPHSLKVVKCCLNTLRLVDDIRRIGPVYGNLDALEKVNRALLLEDIQSNEVKLKYFYSNYDEYKREIREQNRKYVLNKWNIYRMEHSDSKDIDELNRMKDENKKIEGRISRKQLLKEKIICSEAVSINKHNRWRLHWKFGADLLSFAANIIEVFTFPVVAAFVYACRTPSMVYGICRKICRNEDVHSRGVGVKDDYVLNTLQLPALITDFWKGIDKWIFKKIREKSEDERKKAVLTKQWAYVKDNIDNVNNDGINIFKKIGERRDIKDDKNKQKELVERLILLEDKNIQEEVIRELESIKSQIEGSINDEEKLKELNKDIEKQKKRLEKINGEIINKTGKAPKYDACLLEGSKKKVLNEAIRMIEKEEEDLGIGRKEVERIKLVFEQSKRTLEVLKARPDGHFLKYFNIKPMEDEDRMKSTAKFVIKHIKDVPNVDNLKDVYGIDIDNKSLNEEEKEKLRVKIDNISNEVKRSHERIKEMLRAFNMSEEEAQNFKNNVVKYKIDKDNAPKSKQDLIDELVEKMKKEI